MNTSIITEVAVTTARVPDCKIDLTKPDEIVYRDKGYVGAKPKAIGNATMKRASRFNPLGIKDILRNKRIMKKRCPGERPYGVMKRVMHGGHTRLTELHRVFAQQVMCCFTYNLMQMERIILT